jgi:hypothetical protein
MLGWSKRTKWLIVGATGSACAVGLAVGLLTLSNGSTRVQTLAAAALSPPGQVTPATAKTTSHASARRTTKHVAPSSPQTSRATSAAVTPATTTSTTAPRTPLPAATVPASIGTSVATAPPATAKTTTSPPTTQPAAPPAILQPSTAAVDQAISGLAAYVKSPIKPSVAEVNTLGGEVCTAFSQGSTVSQIEAALVQRLGSIPFTTVLPGASAYVVDTTVSLYCPSYSSQLG